MNQFLQFLTGTVLVGVVLSACSPGVRAPQCDFICKQNLGSDKLVDCCHQAGFPGGGGCPDMNTVWCVAGDTSGCPNAERTPQCDVACTENRGSVAMIQCCKANGFLGGGCPDGKQVFCTRS